MTTIDSPKSLPDSYGLFLREAGEAGVVDSPDADTEDRAGARAEKSLLCRQCRSVITSDRHAASVNSNHLHTFFNPAGIVFEIRCFSQAKGCAVHGQPTAEFSWFKGYVWRYALCAACLVHLGWLFDSGEHFFFGLIRGKLVEG